MLITYCMIYCIDLLLYIFMYVDTDTQTVRKGSESKPWMQITRLGDTGSG